jgi:hypothetical protein
VDSLRALTVKNGDQFARVVTEKLLTYAIGRGLEYDDMPMLRAIAREAKEDDYKFSSLLMGVIESPAFMMNQKSSTDATTGSETDLALSEE